MTDNWIEKVPNTATSVHEMRKGKYFRLKQSKIRNFYTAWASVADPNPDPPDPYVFGPPGSGSQSISMDPDPSIIKQK